MSNIAGMNVKAVGSTAKGDSGRERLQLRKAKMTPEIAAIIVKVTKIPERDLKFVYISDKLGSLIMLHPREVEGTLDAPFVVRENRGAIIDLDRETIVAHGDLLGTGSVQPKLATVGNKLILGRNIPVEANPNIYSCGFSRYIPHVNLRVFRWDGKTYIASHNTIDTVANKSRWGDHGILFADMLKECGLENPEALFPEGCNYSPHVHMFNVCHPSLNICSFLKSAPSGFIVRRSSSFAWHTGLDYVNKSGMPIGRIPTAEEIGVPDTNVWRDKSYGRIIQSPMDGPGFYSPKFEGGDYRSVDKFLNQGYYDVPGPYGTGEAVMVNLLDDFGVEDIHMIMSPAFSRRKDCIWKNDYNLYHSAILHFGMVPLAFENKGSFITAWPPYPLATQEIIDAAKRQGVPPIQIAHLRSLPSETDIQELKKGVNQYTYMVRQKKAAPLNNMEDALNVVHSNLIYTSSPYYQDLIQRTKMRFAVDVRDLIAFIQSMDGKIPKDFPFDSRPDRGPRSTLAAILANASSSAKTSVALGQNTYLGKNGLIRHYSERELVDYNIATAVPMIQGTPLYQLIRTFRLYDKTTSLLITEPNARPRSIVEAEQQKFDSDYPILVNKVEDVSIPLVETEVPADDDVYSTSGTGSEAIYGPSAPTCSWASVASKPAPRVDEPSTVVHTSSSSILKSSGGDISTPLGSSSGGMLWSEISPVTPPSKPKDEPLPEWLASTVTLPAPVSLPSRGRASSTRGRGSSTRGASLRPSPRSPTSPTGEM